MSDIINLLPDAVANQIAAGEVVQRPASAVKELLENAIDASATDIQLIVKDAGRTLIQVIDNGKGMSVTDARLCFERHATSKIKEANDLFHIRTMGFRGEALASIAAVAQVELKTRTPDSELGTQIIIEGSETKSQEPVQCSVGTSISVKNLFFNIPARRNFLKGDKTEFEHIRTEFKRVALVNPHVSFSLHTDGKAEYNLETGNFKQRIVGIFGNNYNQRLLPVEQAVSQMKISGFIGKPEFAMKTKGEQFFFVNNRFIKHHYLDHAVKSVYKELIAPDATPSYFLNIEIDPKYIDVNIHPTKTEIKFMDEKLIYGILHSSVKKSIGVHHLAPSIDFSLNPEYEVTPAPKDYTPEMPGITVNPNYNPFEHPASSSGSGFRSLQTHAGASRAQTGAAYLERFKDLHDFNSVTEHVQQCLEIPENTVSGDVPVFQFQLKYMVSHLKSGILLIDQQRAHERILYEEILQKMENEQSVSQHKLFPQTIDFSPANAEILREIKNDLKHLGWDVEEFGQNAFIIHAMPNDIKEEDTKSMLERILESFKQNLLNMRSDRKSNLALSIARNTALKSGVKLENEEMNNLINRLFACKVPEMSPSGKRTYIIIGADELLIKFE